MVVKCQEVPVFHPTLRDVNGSWEAYIESIERRFAHVGLAKIVPPKGWTPRKAGYSDDFDFPIPRPIRWVANTRDAALYACRAVDCPLWALKPRNGRRTYRISFCRWTSLQRPNYDGGLMP